MLAAQWIQRPDNRLLLAGWLFTTGNYAEIASSQYCNIVDLVHGRLDLAHTDIGQLAGAFLFLISGQILACALGRQRAWFLFSCMLAIVALLSTNATALMELPHGGWCALGGTVLYTLSYGIGSALTVQPRTTVDSPRGVLARVMQRPRRLMGIGGATSMLFSLPDATNLLLGAIFLAWFAGELLLAWTDED